MTKMEGLAEAVDELDVLRVRTLRIRCSKCDQFVDDSVLNRLFSEGQIVFPCEACGNIITIRLKTLDALADLMEA
jgi:ribosomal protein S27E